MAKEICISSTPHETRLAILEDDQLAEIYYERENEYTLAGSIYNGRVTRVLPGMQSAFVDLGLERDAFLYVTDFLELEDQEESDELEKAASTGSTQAPREVRHPNGQGADRGQRSEQKPEQQRQPRTEPDKPGRDGGRDRRPSRGLEIEKVTSVAPPSSTLPSGAGEADEEPGEPGAKRWRGRRRRRGGRGPAGAVTDPVETEASAETFLDPSAGAESEVAPEIQASAGDRTASTGGAAPSHTGRPHRQSRSDRGDRSERGSRADRGDRFDRSDRGDRGDRGDRSDVIPVPFVLPGESLSKYGGEPEADTSQNAGEASAQSTSAAKPSSTFKPSTLIETPLAWDGSGLLPGESLSKHRGRPSESFPEVSGEPMGVFSDSAAGKAEAEPADFDEEFIVEESEEFAPEGSETTVETGAGAPDDRLDTEELVEEEQPEEQLPGAPAGEGSSDPFASDPFFTHPSEGASQEGHTSKPQGDSEGDDYIRYQPIEQTSGSESETSAETDRDASHHVDPLPPSKFRLFGLGGKKKKEETAPPELPTAVKLPSTVGSVSAYAPGSGLVEEEIIEGEEFEAPHHHHKGDDHDLDEYEEEEKTHTQIRSGEVGEMLQEAHLDHRIQLNFEDRNSNVEGEEVFDMDEEEEEAAGADGQPGANGSTTDTSQQRRERGGRGRRGGRGTPQSGGPSARRGGPPRRSAQSSDLPIISDLLKPGQEILVQIAKEPIAKKGARITSHIALPGRFLVFMPTVTHVGVSRKIASDEERQRLKRILTSERGDAAGGFIVRTAAEGASEEELRSDLRFLIHLWDEIKQRSESSKSPALIYHDLSLIERILRDQVSANFSSIWVDSEADYERIVRFLNRFSPTLVRRVKLYTKETPLFEHFGIQDEISKALRSKVWLKSGGSIVINQTEALVAIDINTGKFVGKTARLEDTIVKTNLDAIPEIVRQIRLRDLGGIIIIDFIDMDERKNRFKVMAALEEALKNDRAPTKVLQFNDFGLVAITRKRVKQSLERTLSVPCPTCQATGMVKSPATVCNEIYTELRKMRKHFENADVLLRVNPETVKVLKSNNASWITEFEELIGKNILIKSDATLHPEQFDIQG